MTKYKRNMIWSIVFIVMSIVLTVYQVNDSEYGIRYLAEDASLVIFGVYCFCLNLKKERNMKRVL